MNETMLTVSPAMYHAYFEPAVTMAPEQLFSYQVKRLRSMGFVLHSNEVDTLCQWIPNEYGRFFLIVPGLLSTIHIKANVPRMKIFHGRSVCTVSGELLLANMDIPIWNAHLLLGVEDGRARLGLDPATADEQIRKEGRIGYNSWEAIVHCCVFPFVLRHHSLDIVRSYDRLGNMISLQGNSDTIIIASRSKIARYPGFGAPSANVVIQAI
jgi:hypothetical protein